MTLIELLVVIAIIAMILSLSLPAIQAARESARQTQCRNNLKQISLACLSHEQTHGYLPSGGWGGAWVGVPGRGSGPRQPGGWVYVLLPYLERNDLAEVGRGSPQQQRAGMARVLQTPLSVFNCPTRRRAMAYPIHYGYARRPFGSAAVSQVARSDYAINCGDQPRCEISGWFNPPSLSAGDNPRFAWPDVSDHTGVSYLRSQITFAHLRDGSSRTYLIGEKYLSIDNYGTGVDHGDDWSMYTGYQDDTHRSTHLPPRRDDALERPTCRFGSQHPSVWNIAFCDGSVRPLSYDISPAVHRSLGNRRDGRAFGDDEIK